MRGICESMKQMVTLAKKHHVKIGAHPSYPDKLNFGRISVKMDENALKESILTQIDSLKSICDKENVPMHHIKPHGALYNDIAKDEELTLLFLKSIKKYKTAKFLYVPPKSVIEELAQENGFSIKLEAFGDRNYDTHLNLVSRKKVNALITEPKTVLKQVLNIFEKGMVRTESGSLKELSADTYCIHGDTSSALQILTYLSEQLPNYNIYLNK